MKRYRVLVAVLALAGVFLLLGLVSLPESEGRAAAAWRHVEKEASNSSAYRLSSLTWQVTGTSSGGGYLLRGPAAPSLRGSGCCCTFLPLIQH